MQATCHRHNALRTDPTLCSHTCGHRLPCGHTCVKQCGQCIKSSAALQPYLQRAPRLRGCTAFKQSTLDKIAEHLTTHGTTLNAVKDHGRCELCALSKLQATTHRAPPLQATERTNVPEAQTPHKHFVTPQPSHLATLETLNQVADLSDLRGVTSQLLALAAAITCVVCSDDFKTHDGVECSSESNAHFLCNECFDGHVSESCSSMNIARAAASKSLNIQCPCANTSTGGCTSEPYTAAVIARHASATAFEKYLAAKDAVVEARVATEVGGHWEARLEAVQQKLLEATDRREARRRHIADKILTSSCPRCSQAFVDYSGCGHLTCSRCGCGFCAYCLNESSHSHHHGCQGNTRGENMRGWTLPHNMRVAQRLQHYLATLNPEEKALTLHDCRADLIALGLKVSDFT